MSRVCLIGVDVGTQGTKAAVYTEEGQLLASAFRPSRLINPAFGVVEQDPDEMYDSFLDAVREAVENSGERNFAAIGLDGQMAGILGIDRDYNAVTPYDSWLDTRCGKYIEQIKRTAEDRVIQLTGCPVTVTHGPKVLWWKNERPEAYKKIDKFVLPTAYIAGRLAGLKSSDAYIDYTHIHFSGFADVENMKWSDELLELFGVGKGKMPQIVEPWKIVGRLTAQAAQSMGLSSGIPIIAGCGDQAATSLGAGVTRKGLIFDVAGTASVFSCCVDEYRPDVRNKTIIFSHSVLKGLWTPLAYISGGGLCMKWFKENVVGSCEYFDLDQEARTVAPGSGGLVFVPHFSGRTCPNDPSIRGTWVGLNWSHEKKHLYRSIMESIAYEYGMYLRYLRELLGDVGVSHVITIGGGSRSALFSAIKADVLGVPYLPLGVSDTATLGSAITAGYGAGVYPDIAQAASGILSTKKETVNPNAENHALYAKYVSAYEELFGSLNRLYGRFGATVG